MKRHRRGLLCCSVAAQVAWQHVPLSSDVAAVCQCSAYACIGTMAAMTLVCAVVESNLFLSGHADAAEMERQAKNEWYSALVYGIALVSFDSAVVPAVSGDIGRAVVVAFAPPLVVIYLFALLLSIQYPSTDDK